MVDVPVVQVPQFIDGVDVSVIMQRRGLAHSEGATDSLHRWSQWTFLLCHSDGVRTAQAVLLAAWGLHMAVGGLSVSWDIFRAPSIRTLSVLGVAGTPGVLILRCSATGLHACGHTHRPPSIPYHNNNNQQPTTKNPQPTVHKQQTTSNNHTTTQPPNHPTTTQQPNNHPTTTNFHQPPPTPTTNTNHNDNHQQPTTTTNNNHNNHNNLGLLGAFLRGVALLILFGMLLCFQVLFIFGILIGLVFLFVVVTAEDVCLWPYSVDILVKLVTFFWVLFIGPLLVVI